MNCQLSVIIFLFNFFPEYGIYNNVFFYNGLDGTTGGSGIWFKGVSGAIRSTRLKNNIFRLNDSGAWTSSGKGSMNDQEVEGNWKQTGDPLFIDAVINKLSDPFNRNYPDFNLQSKSPCIDRGVFFTKTVSSGKGTKIQVKDAHYFIDGWGIVEGDFIKLENQIQTFQIVNVDYVNNIITVDRSLRWSANQGIALNYNGSTPDIGAIESGGTNDNTGLSLYAPQNLKIIVVQ